MKLKSMLFAALVATSSAVFAAESAPLTFNGVLTLSNAQQFGLVNADASRTAWVKIGGEFDGYIVKSYEAASKTLSLEKEGKAYTVSMADSRFDGSAKPLGTKATLADAQAVIDQMHFEKMLEKSLEGQQKAMAKMMEQAAGKSGGKVSPEDLMDFRKKMMGTLLEAMNPEQMKKDMAEIYSQTFTKEELASVAAFNATPAGQAMIEKQPDIQQKLQELMMPRMMAAMPKMQKIGMEFGQQQKAKAEALAKANATPEAAAGATPAAPTKP